MNVVVEGTSSDPGGDVGFSVAELTGVQAARRAFMLARVARSELPSSKGINFDDAARYL
jgi:hypothetical protein